VVTPGAAGGATAGAGGLAVDEMVVTPGTVEEEIVVTPVVASVAAVLVGLMTVEEMVVTALMVVTPVLGSTAGAAEAEGVLSSVDSPTLTTLAG